MTKNVRSPVRRADDVKGRVPTSPHSRAAWQPKLKPVMCELGARTFLIDADLVREFRARVETSQRHEADVISWLLRLYVGMPHPPKPIKTATTSTTEANSCRNHNATPRKSFAK